jgi:exoribonuclease-2
MSLRRGETGVTPGPHFALGADAYAQATSPLRRYADLANHRQLVAIATARPAPYDEDALAEIAALSGRAERDGRRAERAAVRYWLLAHLRRRVGEAVEGVVVETGARTIVQLVETLLEETVPGLEGVEPGDPVSLDVVHANPRADVLRLRSRVRP